MNLHKLFFLLITLTLLLTACNREQAAGSLENNREGEEEYSGVEEIDIGVLPELEQQTDSEEPIDTDLLGEEENTTEVQPDDTQEVVYELGSYGWPSLAIALEDFNRQVGWAKVNEGSAMAMAALEQYPKNKNELNFLIGPNTVCSLLLQEDGKTIHTIHIIFFMDEGYDSEEIYVTTDVIMWMVDRNGPIEEVLATLLDAIENGSDTMGDSFYEGQFEYELLFNEYTVSLFITRHA